MAKFIKVSPVETGEMYINVERITLLERVAELTRISFPKKAWPDGWVLVHETPAQILAMIKDRANANEQ